MDEMFKSLKSAYDADTTAFNALRTANTGGLYLEEQRQGTARPYIVLHHLGTTSEYTMGGSELKESSVEFELFAATVSTLMGLVDKATTAFDDLSLAYENDSAILMERTAEGEMTKELDYWSTILEYRVIRQAAISGGHIVEAHIYNLMSI